MIIHRLIALHRNYEENALAFFELQARDAIRWLQRGGLEIGPETRMLDLGCGHGYFGRGSFGRGCFGRGCFGDDDGDDGDVDDVADDVETFARFCKHAEFR